MQSSLHINLAIKSDTSFSPLGVSLQLSAVYVTLAAALIPAVFPRVAIDFSA